MLNCSKNKKVDEKSNTYGSAGGGVAGLGGVGILIGSGGLTFYKSIICLPISAYYLAKNSIAYLSVSNEYYKLNRLFKSNGKSKLSLASCSFSSLRVILLWNESEACSIFSESILRYQLIYF